MGRLSLGLLAGLGLCVVCVLLIGLSTQHTGTSELLGGDDATLAARELLLSRLRGGLADRVSAERVEGSKVDHLPPMFHPNFLPISASSFFHQIPSWRRLLDPEADKQPLQVKAFDASASMRARPQELAQMEQNIHSEEGADQGTAQVHQAPLLISTLTFSSAVMSFGS